MKVYYNRSTKTKQSKTHTGLNTKKCKQCVSFVFVFVLLGFFLSLIVTVRKCWARNCSHCIRSKERARSHVNMCLANANTNKNTHIAKKANTKTFIRNKKQKSGGKQIPCYYVEIITSDNNECSHNAVHTHTLTHI